MKFFFAYRLPGQSDPTWIEGYAMRVSALSEIPADGFVFHSFTGDEIYIAQDYQVIDQSRFLCFISEETSQHISTRNEYEQQLDSFFTDLRNHTFQKLILSRLKKINTTTNAIEIFNQLNKNYSGTYNSIFSSAETGTWIGASPELLLRSNGNKIETVALAGTKPADGNSVWTQKEINEQAYVTEYIVDVFEKNQLNQISVSEPYTVNAGSIEHIKTDIAANFDSRNQILQVLNSMHPTPATCGIPKKEALQKIKETELHQRKMYAGFYGIIQNENALFFVNLRCMELFADYALLYVGGGITKESIGENEWNETERKAETLSSVL